MDGHDLGFYHTSADITSRILDFIKSAEWFPLVNLREKDFLPTKLTESPFLLLVICAVEYMLMWCRNKLSKRIPADV